MQTFPEAYDLFIFDLDGTIADTCEDLAESVNHALSMVGAARLDLSTVRSYVGDGARRLMERAVGGQGNEETISAALAAFLSHYRDACTQRTRLYPGAREGLEGLRARGKLLTVLTNKPQYPTLRILESLGVAPLFARIEGGDAVPARKPDPAALLRCTQDLGVSRDRTLMVGDSGIDVRTARAAGVGVAFVPYGFRPETPNETPPDYVLSSLEDLLGPMSSRALLRP